MQGTKNQTHEMQLPERIPVIPMVRILTKYAAANNIPLNIRSWESIMRCYQVYNRDAKFLN